MYICIYIYIYIYTHVYIHTYTHMYLSLSLSPSLSPKVLANLRDAAQRAVDRMPEVIIVAIFYPFSQFCEIDIFLLSLQKQPTHSPKFISEGGSIWQVLLFNKL